MVWCVDGESREQARGLRYGGGRQKKEGRYISNVESQASIPEDRLVKVTVTVTLDNPWDRTKHEQSTKQYYCHRLYAYSDAYIPYTHHQYEYDHSSTTQYAASGEQGRCPPA